MKMPFRMSVMPSLLFAALVSLTGCDVINLKGREPGEIPFKLVSRYGGMSNDNEYWTTAMEYGYFGFYLSKPEVRIDGKWQRVKFKQTQWQTPNIALLKFHNK